MAKLSKIQRLVKRNCAIVTGKKPLPDMVCKNEVEGVSETMARNPEKTFQMFPKELKIFFGSVFVSNECLLTLHKTETTHHE